MMGKPEVMPDDGLSKEMLARSRLRGNVLLPIANVFAEDREPEWPKERRNCGFLRLESAYSPNEP
jgi:hypothetical protein